MRLTRGLVALGMGMVVSLAGALGARETSAQECHPAYGGCLAIVADLNGEDIGWGVYHVWDVNNDLYGLDVLYSPGNG